MVNWAETIGPNTARLFERILADKPHPEMGYRGCLGIIRLADQYSRARVEAAAERALLTGACRYQSVKSILKNSLDAITPAATRRDLWEICEDRYQVRSTILTSQLPVSRWHEQIGDPTLADGILDWLVHNAHRIEMRGDSMRKSRPKAQQSNQ